MFCNKNNDFEAYFNTVSINRKVASEGIRFVISSASANIQIVYLGDADIS